jgi:AAA domain
MSAGDHSDMALLCEPVARIVWGQPSSETASQLRWGTRGSRVLDRAKGVWHDHERGVGGGTLDLVPAATRTEQLQWLRDRGLISGAPGNGGAASLSIVATYNYMDESGAPLFEVVRLSPKDFRQRRPNGKGGWNWSLGDARRVLYRLPEVRDAAASGRLVLVVEGEKDTDNLRKLGFTATCNPGGANKWRAEYNESLRGADVVIIGDNDPSGRSHAAHVASSLKDVARRVRVLDLCKAWPACPAKGDISDWIEASGTAEALLALIEALPEWVPAEADGWRQKVFDAATLQTMRFPPLKFVLPDFVPEGAALLVSRPKLGKSWLVLDLAIATAAGRFTLGELEPSPGDVLYLALEDGKRRLQRRITKLLPTFSLVWPPQLKIATEWRRADQGGLSDIESWILSVGVPRLIIIDTLAQFRKVSNGKTQAYADDYAAISELQRLASKYNVGIVIVHHDRKAEADDVFDTVSGTLGLSAAADTILIMKRKAGAVTLYVRGRDIEESETALQFNKSSCKWTILGAAAEVFRSAERGRVLNALAGAVEGLDVSEIQQAAELPSRNAADQLLLKMFREGEVIRVRRGVYRLPNLSEGEASKIGKKERNGSQPTDLAAESDNLTDLTDLTSINDRKPALGPRGDSLDDFT